MSGQKQPTLTQRITALKKQCPQQHYMTLDLLALCGAFIKIKGSQEYPDHEKFRFVAMSAMHVNHIYDSQKLSLENVYDMIEYYRQGNRKKTKNKFNHMLAMIILQRAKEIKESDLNDTEIKEMLNSFVEKPNTEIPPMHLEAKTETPICFSIVYWNVEGLAKNYLIIGDLLKFDVIILSETHIRTKNTKELNEYLRTQISKSHEWFHYKASRRGKIGRGIGGMLMGVKACLQQKAIETVNPFIIAREVEINGSMHTIIGVYRRPTKSLATDNELKIELATLLDRYPDRTIVLGDLNAYIGTLGNRGDPRGPRNSMDMEIDKEGREWIKFFQEHGIQILNGNKDGDWQGKLTHPNKREQRSITANSPGTVIDYAGATEQVFEDIRSFEVISMEESDHDQITITFGKQEESGDHTDITLETKVNIAQMKLVRTQEDAWKFINQYRKLKDKDSPTDEDFFEHFRGLMKGTTEKHASDDDPSTDFEIRDGELEDAMSFLQEDLEVKQDKDGLLATFKNCLKGKSIPDDWRVTKIYPVHTKGVKTYLDSYQGIHKTNINYKIWAHVLSMRLTDEIDMKISNSRWKLHKVRSANDSRYILNSFIQEGIQNKRGGERLSVLFIDLKKAFQSVDRNRLWKIMEEVGINMYLINCCKDIYKTTPMQIGETENQFYTTSGLKQNCPLSPILLALYIGFLNKDANKLKNKSKSVLINCIPYYDDMVVIAKRDDMKLVLGKVELDNLDLTADDMELVVFSKSGIASEKDECSWNGTLVKVEKLHTFLGFTFQSDGDFTEHTQHRASEANRMLRLVYDLGKGKDIQTRIQMFNCLVKPGLNSGSELFGWKQYKALEDVQVRYLKWVLSLGMDLSDHKVLKTLPLYINGADNALRYELRANTSRDSFLCECIRENQKAAETHRRNHMKETFKWSDFEEEQKAREKHKDNPMRFYQEAKERHIQFYKKNV